MQHKWHELEYYHERILELRAKITKYQTKLHGHLSDALINTYADKISAAEREISAAQKKIRKLEKQLNSQSNTNYINDENDTPAIRREEIIASTNAAIKNARQRAQKASIFARKSSATNIDRSLPGREKASSRRNQQISKRESNNARLFVKIVEMSAKETLKKLRSASPANTKNKRRK